MPNIEIGELRADELAAAAALLGRAYRDNPWMVAMIGGDPALREQVLVKAHGFRISPLSPPTVVARRDGELVGVCGSDPPFEVIRSADDGAEFARIAVEAGPDVLPRLQVIISEFGRRGPQAPHWHLGPVGVRIDAQKQGIGGMMLARFCEMLDERGELSALETEEPDNVRLYERFGWEVVEEAEVLGVRGWFMRRDPR
jgi:ribosomal protein S18 acetylase RimI-like enzyme